MNYSDIVAVPKWEDECERREQMKIPSGWIARPKLDRKGINLEVEMSELILCKDCKYFEDDSFANVDGIPLIVAHEICKKWGEGCKTNENGYCFLAELKGEQE